MISESFVYTTGKGCQWETEKTDTQLLKEDVQVFPASLAVCSDTVLHTAWESTE